MFKYILIAIALLTLSCSGSTKEEKLAVTSEPPKEASAGPAAKEGKKIAPPTAQAEEAKPFNFQFVDSATMGMVQKLDSIYKRTPYYFKANKKTYFYVCEGSWEKPEHDSFPDEITGMGIVDEQGNFILEPRYHKIYNPDATAKDFIEIEANGKKGLLNYQTAKLIPCEFDIIFPSDKQETVAIGKIEDEYFYISKDGIKQKISSADEIPSFREMESNWNFDAILGNHIMLRDSYNHFFVDDANEGNGIVFTPSYLQPLGLFPEIHNYLIQGTPVEFGTTISRGELLDKKSLSDKVMAFIFSFYENGINARGNAIRNHHLATIDSVNNVVETKRFLTESLNHPPNYFCLPESSGYKFINDSILEVFEVKTPKKDHRRYDNMTLYTYFSVNRNGEIKKLDSNRFFDFTKYIPLTEAYFHGCFSKHIWDSPENYKEVPGEGNLLLLDHLDVEDLDIMRNEVFADYGYIFKTEKWHNYFSAKPWYLPMYDSVDSLLTETDKANIALILKVKEKILQDSTIVNKRKIQYAAAG